MSYVIGVDVGGTFTDGVLHDDDGAVVAGKAPSTPPDYSRGVMDVLAVLAEQIGETVEEMLAKTQHIAQARRRRLLIHRTTKPSFERGAISRSTIIATMRSQ